MASAESNNSQPHSTTASQSISVVVECWENQRHVPFKGWGHFRLPTDRPSWSDKKGAVALHRETFLLPSGWQWVTPWSVESYDVDGSEWYYAADFTMSTRYCSKTESVTTIARRRKWVRTREPKALPPPSSWCHFTWCEISQYGFVGIGSLEDSQGEQARQHLAFSKICPLLASAVVEECNLDIKKEAVSAPSKQISSDLSPRPGSPGSPVDAYGNVVSPSTPQSPSLKSGQLQCVYKYGVPYIIRGQLWARWSGALMSKAASPEYFTSAANAAAVLDTSLEVCQEVAQDVIRTAPKHPYFEGRGSPGALRLTNTLLALSLYPGAPPYHQAFSYMAATLLLNMSPEDTFWTMLALTQSLLPQGYHEHYLLQMDLRIIHELLSTYIPELDEHFEKRQIDVGVFASGWLQGLFCAHFPFPSACRALDVIFCEGNSTILVRLVLAFLKVHKKEILQMDSSGTLGQYANQFARTAYNIDDLMLIAGEDNLSSKVHQRREKLTVTHQVGGFGDS